MAFPGHGTSLSLNPTGLERATQTILQFMERRAMLGVRKGFFLIKGYTNITILN